MSDKKTEIIDSRKNVINDCGTSSISFNFTRSRKKIHWLLLTDFDPAVPISFFQLHSSQFMYEYGHLTLLFLTISKIRNVSMKGETHQSIHDCKYINYQLLTS